MNCSTLLQVVRALGTLLVGATVWADPLPVNPNSWTLAILPDTQKYSASNPSIYNAQTQFLADYQDDLNLAYVLHEGDITDNNSAAQWTNAYNAMRILDGASIGYSMVPGNHDYDQSNTDRNSNMLSPTSFKATELAAQPTYGGVYEAGSFMNSYSTFNAGGKDWLVLALEYGPRDGVVAWADGLMKSHPNHQAMIVTHANLYCDSTLYNNTSQQWNPHSASAFNTDCNVGEEVWQELKDNSNLKFIFNGHVLEDGTGYMADTGDNGNTVHNLLANYQMINNGGDGYMRLLEFMPDGDTVHVRTYSPTLGSYLTSPSQDFTLSLASPPPLTAHAVGANFVVTGEAKPASNSDVNLSVPQSASPRVGITWQKNRGDYELTIGNQDVTYNKGILLATVAQNVRDGYRATVAVGRDSFGDGQMALSLMEAGNSAAAEVNFNTSVAWFEFDAGWQGAHINANGTLAAAQGITQSMITKSGTGRYGVDLDVNSINNGMLFVIGNSGSTNVIVDTGVLADGSGWDIRVQNNVASFSPTGIDNDWSLLYIPYNTENLVGGRYNGNTNANFASAGNFNMTKLGTGQYKLTIPGETPETGMLILTVSYETSSGGITAPDDNILNYQSDGLGNFIINSYDLTNSTALTYQNTEFVWAFIDFSDPIEPPVPEPSTWILVLIATIASAVYNRMSRSDA